jgi:hypothetical protein
VYTWEKRGLIFAPSGDGFFKSHAARPVPFPLRDGVIRLFFSSRDHDDRMLPAFVDVDANEPSRILAAADGPLIGLSAPGTFDDSGMTLGSAVRVGAEVYLYYTGWKRRRVVSFELSIGVLRWDGRSDRIERMFAGPILAQDRTHPFLVAGPFVMRDGDQFRMWYCSGTGWAFPEGNPEPLYTVAYATSPDGLTWTPQAQRVIDYAYDGEVVSAPWVAAASGGFRMWYCKRGHVDRAAKNYTVGYAESPDGVAWTRLDDRAGIARSETGWDSEMICYPAVYEHGSSTYMFYSGNGVGRGGLGYAVAAHGDGG